jgi:tRNA A37 threonylcarbamoyladenosine biosynthesis protein TsaE
LIFIALKHPEEAYELGIEEAYESGVSLIEWPERFGATCLKGCSRD